MTSAACCIQSTLCGYFLHECGRTSVLGQLRMRKQNTKATAPLDVGQSVVPNDAPRDFGQEVAFGAKFQIPVARQKGREMSAPRPYVTEPFRPFTSINNCQQYLYTQQHSSYFLHVVRSSVSRCGGHLTIADALLQKHFYLWFMAIISVVFFHMVRAGAYWHKIHAIHAGCSLTTAFSGPKSSRDFRETDRHWIFCLCYRPLLTFLVHSCGIP